MTGIRDDDSAHKSRYTHRGIYREYDSIISTYQEPIDFRCSEKERLKAYPSMTPSVGPTKSPSTIIVREKYSCTSNKVVRYRRTASAMIAVCWFSGAFSYVKWGRSPRFLPSTSTLALPWFFAVNRSNSREQCEQSTCAVKSSDHQMSN